MNTHVLKDFILESKDGEWGTTDQTDHSLAMRVIRGTDFDRVRLGDLSSVPIRQIPARLAQRKSLEPFDIVIETAGGSKDCPTGRTVLIKPSLFRETGLPLTCASFSRFIRINPKIGDPEYIFWYLQHLYTAGYLRRYHTQHTGVARFQWTTFAQTEKIRLPSRERQEKVASLLNAYDDLIENNARRIGILEEMAQALYRERFVNFCFPGDKKVEMVESELGPVAAGWMVLKVKDIVKRLSTGATYKQAEISEAGQISVVDQSSSELLGYHNDEPAHLASPEKPIIIFGDHTCKMQLMVQPFSLGPNVVPFVARSQLPVQYLYFLVRHLVQTREYKRHWIELTNKVVAVAPLNAASQFAAIVTPNLALIEVLRMTNRNLRRTRDLLLPKLISGEIEVPEAEDALALAAS